MNKEPQKRHTTAPHPKMNLKAFFREVAIVFGAFLVLNSFVLASFEVPTGSMENEIMTGDFLFVNKFIYGIRVPWTNIKFGMGIREPRRGEVIVFKFPKDQDKDFIKRVIGVGGDTVECVRQRAVGRAR